MISMKIKLIKSISDRFDIFPNGNLNDVVAQADKLYIVTIYTLKMFLIVKKSQLKYLTRMKRKKNVLYMYICCC